MSLTQLQKNALLVLRTRLNPRDPANTCTEEIKQHLLAIEPWLTTYIIPTLDTIEPKAPAWLREAVGRDVRAILRHIDQLEK